ncbi:MAG: FAD-dependent oxidoreductase [Anaerolineae bacterium]
MTDQALRVAIIGSGPSGFYAAEYLLKSSGLTVYVDMFDRLPTPYGLVRGGVAPDHQKIKSVTKVYEKIAAHPNFRFFGNVDFGRDLTLNDLPAHYHAVIYAVGAQTDKALGIPGEDLPGSHAATDFVGWYNGHPDYRHLQFDLSQERVAVIGVGNVAMDVARILASSYDELAVTDIADYALEALRRSRVREIYLLGRRGAAQAAFTNPEIKELGELAEADLIVDPAEVELDELSRAWLASPHAEPKHAKNVELLKGFAARPPQNKPKRVIVRFLVSPLRIDGQGCVEQLTLTRNTLIAAPDGDVKARATDQTETLRVGLVFRSVGYTGVALPDVPFDAKRGIIPNDHGRVLDGDAPLIGQYAVGWIKRGATGIIGTNKPDSVETAKLLVEDAAAGRLWEPTQPPTAVESLLTGRGVRFTTFADWLKLDALEVQAGAAQNRPRVKFTQVEDMLAALDAAREADTLPGD